MNAGRIVVQETFNASCRFNANMQDLQMEEEIMVICNLNSEWCMAYLSK